MADILNIAAGSGNLLSLQGVVYDDNGAGFSVCGMSVNIDGAGAEATETPKVGLYGNITWPLGGIRFNTSVVVQVRAEASKEVRYDICYTED